MAIIVQGHVPAAEFALSDSLTALSNVEFETELIVESGDASVMPLVWVCGADCESVQSVLGDDPSIEHLELLAELENEQLYRMEWVERVELVFQMITNGHATVMNAHGAGENWYLRVLYPDRDSLNKTNDFCENNSLSFDIRSIREMDGEPAGRHGLTNAQHEALTLAVKLGYYDVPRENDIQDVAEHLDITHQALSERLRRATETLVDEALLVGARVDETHHE